MLASSLEMRASCLATLVGRQVKRESKKEREHWLDWENMGSSHLGILGCQVVVTKQESILVKDLWFH